MSRLRIIAAITVIALAAGGCAGRGAQSDMPVGIGGGPNQLKSSPCACIEQPNAAKTSITG